MYNTFYHCTGNPKNHFSINDVKKLIANISIQRGYRTRSRQPILPSNVKYFHDHVKVLNFGIQPLSYYVILLLSIKYGLRYISFSHLDFEKFECNHKLWKFSEGSVKYLVVSIKEKLDRIFTLYKVPSVDLHPHFCLLCHFLILIHMLPYDDGYLLPTNINYPLEIITEDKCSQYFQSVYNDFFRHGGIEKMNVDNQNFRVSYYLFGFLGFGVFEELRDNGRHKSDSMTTKYFQDSRSLCNVINNDPVLLQEKTVPEFQNLLLHNCGDNLRHLYLFQNASLPVSKLRDCATIFEQKMRCVDQHSPHYKDPVYLLNKSYNMKFNKNSFDGDNLNNILSSFGLNNTKTNQLKYYINNFISCSLSNNINNNNQNSSNSDNEQNDTNPNDALNDVDNNNNFLNTDNINENTYTTTKPVNNNTNLSNINNSNSENVVINNTNITLQHVMNNNSNSHNNNNIAQYPNLYNNNIHYNVNKNFNNNMYTHILYTNNVFLCNVSFNYLSTTAFPIINITCIEFFSDRHNKTGLKLKKDLSRHLISCINSKTNDKMISLILSQFRMIREVASIKFQNDNLSEHECFFENRKLFRPGKHNFVKYLVKFEKFFLVVVFMT